MASQIRYYRTRHQQQRAFIDRLKHDLGELKKYTMHWCHPVLPPLQFGGHDPYPRRGYDVPVSERQDALNSNGKRPRTETHPYEYGHGQQATTSSPRSIITPLGPNRLTIPQGQPAPNLSSNNVEKSSNPSSRTDPPPLGAAVSQAQRRPASGFIDKYAYVPSATPQHRPQQLTHTQASPQIFKRTKPDQAQQQTRSQQVPQNQGYRSMPPPPTPARFKAAGAIVPSNSLTSQFAHRGQVQGTLRAQVGQQQQRTMVQSTQSMRQHSGNAHPPQGKIHDTAYPNASHPSGDLSTASNRFLATAQQFVPPSSAGQTLSMGNGPQRFVPSGSRAPSRSQRPDLAGGGQRMPFVSRGQGPGGHI
ncbi:hypothetical protein LshimejAT787_0204150 [Lyophyllum shimeji]|uniref:Uncharacterized protein n=1 Tax=Lyophyllum shimeji TaxID=47721 RepID=A0A9P3PF60_LYOSH|nr:hypothetical protein LshimejAT787_0204150 [Lyophyllum shimeji]